MTEEKQITLGRAYEKLRSDVSSFSIKFDGDVFQTNPARSGKLHHSGRFTLNGEKNRDLGPSWRDYTLDFLSGTSYSFSAQKDRWSFYELDDFLEIGYGEILQEDGNFEQSVLTIRGHD